MRQRKKRKKKYNKVKPYVRPPEFKRSKRTYLGDKTLMLYLIWMYNSLDERQLVTKKIKTENPQFSNHWRRINENTNPFWFRELCSSYLEDRKGYRGLRKRRRKPKYADTKIQAIDTQKALTNFIKNGYSHSKYAWDYIEIARELKKEMQLADKLYRKGEDIETINQECKNIRDLEDISMELKEKEPFKVAKGFEDFL